MYENEGGSGLLLRCCCRKESAQLGLAAAQMTVWRRLTWPGGLDRGCAKLARKATEVVKNDSSLYLCGYRPDDSSVRQQKHLESRAWRGCISVMFIGLLHRKKNRTQNAWCGVGGSQAANHDEAYHKWAVGLNNCVGEGPAMQVRGINNGTDPAQVWARSGGIKVAPGWSAYKLNCGHIQQLCPQRGWAQHRRGTTPPCCAGRYLPLEFPRGNQSRQNGHHNGR